MSKNAKQWYNVKKASDTIGEIRIYGLIVSEKWYEGDVAPMDLQKELDALGDISQLNVYINSPGGNVYDGIAIYRMLRRHKANVTTYIDGMAASIASVIFQAGDERVMPENTMMFVHSPWTYGAGNAKDFRALADDLDKIESSIMVTYNSRATIKPEKMQELVDAESYITAADAVSFGLADSTQEGVDVNASLEDSLLTVNGVSLTVSASTTASLQRCAAIKTGNDLLNIDIPARQPAPVAAVKPDDTVRGLESVDYSTLEMTMAENTIIINHFSIERG